MTTLPPEDIEQAIAWRHDLHAHPELAFEEKRTSAFVVGLLSEWGLKVETGIAGTGVVATLGDGSGPRLGLRADMDALPIAEETGLAHASRTAGVMHACGHDGHTAMLLLAAKTLAKTHDGQGTIHFIFQPAEENEGGGRAMVEAGLFDRADCDAVFSLHNWPGLPTGSMRALNGPMMAAFAVFDIDIAGQGGHAAMPHLSNGVVSAAASILSALHELPARRIDPLDPAVVSVTQINAGTAWNVNPDTAKLAGTARWFSPAAGEVIERELAQVVHAIAAAHGCTATIRYERRYPATVNSVEEAALVRALAPELGLRHEDGPPSMASEDFAFMLEARPGAYVWLGAARDGENPGLHSPRFDFNDAILPDGTRFWIALAERYLRGDI